jgi:hypothetical protein
LLVAVTVLRLVADKAATAVTLPSLAKPLSAVAVVAAVSLPVALAALVAVAVHQTRRVLQQQSSVAALALEVKAMLAVLVFALRATPSVKAAAAAALAVEGPLQHPQVGLALAVLAFPTPSRLALHNSTLVAAAVDQ